MQHRSARYRRIEPDKEEEREQDSTMWCDSRVREGVCNVRNTAVYNSACFYLTFDNFATEI